jgi:hypothetical protein
VSTRRATDGDEHCDLDLAWRLVRGVTSNAIVLVRGRRARSAFGSRSDDPSRCRPTGRSKAQRCRYGVAARPPARATPSIRSRTRRGLPRCRRARVRAAGRIRSRQ